MTALHWHTIAATAASAAVDAWIIACLIAAGAAVLRWGFRGRR